jgi:hypothetical protein
MSAPSRIVRFLPAGKERVDSLGPLVEALNQRRDALARVPVAVLLDLFDDFSRRLLQHADTRTLDGVAFLSSWLRRSNLEGVLRLNLGGTPAYLDGFVQTRSMKMAAKPRGLVSMWMAGNVPTLPLFSMVAALLAKNVCLVKLALENDEGMIPLLAVLSESEAPGLAGAELLQAAAVIWFDYLHQDLNEEMSWAADTKIMWGGAPALKAISALARREHATEIAFGPKYSIGVLDRRRLNRGEGLEGVVAAFVRDIAAFDQRACSAPQTIFVEKNSRLSLGEVGELFAKQFRRLPPKATLDFYTTVRILNVRAEWALDEQRDVIASGADANWTICLDHEASMKEAVQSRTIFLSEIESWREILPLITPKIQSIGIAFGEPAEAEEFAGEATFRGAARCVRPGLMNGFESPWDGKLLVSELVRWVSLKA